MALPTSAKIPALPVDIADLTGKTVIVLGANTGLGFEASKHFATMHPEKLILACRDASRGHAALEKLQADTGYTNAEVWIVDLARFASVSAFADRAQRELGRLDILVQNAAIGRFAYETTVDGWEFMLQVNYLSQALLALRLLPIVARTPGPGKPRIVVVSSGAMLDVKWERSLVEAPAGILKTLTAPEYCPSEGLGMKRYPESKLLDVLLARSLNARLNSNAIIVNSVCPGFCISELRRDFPPEIKAMTVKAEETAAYTSEEGSRQLVFAAVGTVGGEGEGEGEGEDGLRGAFIKRNAVQSFGEFIPSAVGVLAEEKVWDETVDLLCGVDPQVRAIVSTYLK